MVVENGTRVSKILQIFSRQASLMDALISGFVAHLKDHKGTNDDVAENNRINNPQQYSTDNGMYIQ